MTAWLTDTMIATSALMLLVLALREPVRRQFGATAAYALWLLPALRMAMPPITRTVERIVPAGPSADAPLMIASIAPAAPFADPSLIDQLGGWSALLIALWATGAIADNIIGASAGGAAGTMRSTVRVIGGIAIRPAGSSHKA